MKRHLELKAIEALQDTLRQISVIKIKEIEIEDDRLRGGRAIIAHVEIYGHAHTLVCKIMESCDTSELQHAFAELKELQGRFPRETTPVVIAESLPQQAQDLCRESDTGFLDLTGNARLYLDEVFIVKRSLPLHAKLPPQAETMPNCETAHFAELAQRAPGFLSQGGKH